MKLRIYLSPKVSFETGGTVVWKQKLSDCQGYIGIAFDNLPEDVQDLILEYAFISNDEIDGLQWLEQEEEMSAYFFYRF